MSLLLLRLTKGKIVRNFSVLRDENQRRRSVENLGSSWVRGTGNGSLPAESTVETHGEG
jgi:hypothetical protein